MYKYYCTLHVCTYITQRQKNELGVFRPAAAAEKGGVKGEKGGVVGRTTTVFNCVCVCVFFFSFFFFFCFSPALQKVFAVDPHPIFPAQPSSPPPYPLPCPMYVCIVQVLVYMYVHMIHMIISVEKMDYYWAQ